MAPECHRCRQNADKIPGTKRKVFDATVIAWGHKPCVISKIKLFPLSLCHALRFCEDCYDKYKEKHKLGDKRECILVAGLGVVKQTLERGDEMHYPNVRCCVSVLTGGCLRDNHEMYLRLRELYQVIFVRSRFSIG